jgi:hypothetical protein
MAAGLGFKDFQTGEVLTAADVDGYLMQGIWVFANATARDAAVTSPQEGNFAFLKDTNTTTYYTGSAWTNLDTTGMVNPMTTTGDTIYSSSGSTPARLGIGTAGQVLQVNSGATAPEWATPAGGGGKVLQVIFASTATVAVSSSTTQADTGLTATITPSSASSRVAVLIAQNGVAKNSGNSGNAVGLFLHKNGSQILQIQRDAGNTNTALRNDIGSVALTYVDSPASTSALTYKTTFRNETAASEVYVNSTSTSTIILMEIGA